MPSSIYNGFINILKPPGPTSHDIVNKVRRLLNIKKVGHLGTLDPLAAGVLPVAIGKANKLFNELAFKRKHYRAVFTFGKETETGDSGGEVTNKGGRIPSEEEILAVLDKFRGRIMQKPHKYSAVKVGGQKACDIARTGGKVEIKAREVEIYRLELLRQSGAGFTFDIECSGGTYIRSLCCDIAAELETYAYMSMLIRLRSGKFFITNSIALCELEEGDIAKYILPVTYPLSYMDRLDLPDRYYKMLSNGMTIPLQSTMQCELQSTMQKTIYCKGELFGIGSIDDGLLKLDIYLKED